MTELLEWLGRYSPGVVALLALAAAALFILKLSVERGIQAGFEAQAKAAELSLTRRSAFEERILTERYTTVSSFAARLERLATQLNRIRHGQPPPEGFYRGDELVPLTEILEELSVHRLVLGEAFFEALNRQALILLDLGAAGADASWLAARDQVRALAEEQFRIQGIRVLMSLPLFERAAHHDALTAIVVAGASFTYRHLLDVSGAFAARLLVGADDLREARVAFLVPPGFDHVAVQWGIWRAGGIAVPLAVSHPLPELEHAIADSDAGIVVAHPSLAGRVAGIARARGLRFLSTEADGRGEVALPRLGPDRRAMILYTSGTTSRPKGVVITHAALQAQVETLVGAWGWSADDRIPLVLPLHHVHGIVNVLTCALWSGAKCTIHPSFDADAVWRQLAEGEVTLFMAVPTIYSRLIAAWETALPERRRAMSAGCGKVRLMVSGSAALPVAVLERWRGISGHTLLERYGMTEIGMALSNPLRGERRPGHVGLPLPGVDVRLVDEEGRPVEPGTPGEIEVRGPSVFQEYWRKPEATRESFRDGWFRTGDVAAVEEGYYRILGRSSVDILKTGGFKVSALEIEDVLRTHPTIADCAVVGREDEAWGERVCAVVVLRPGATLSPDELRAWATERLAPYKLPRELHVVDDLPRNAMGKVTKPEVKRLLSFP